MKVKDVVKVMEKKRHLVLLSKKDVELTGELKECRTIDNWINFGYNQAIDLIGNLDLDESKLREAGYYKIPSEDEIGLLIYKNVAKPKLTEYEAKETWTGKHYQSYAKKLASDLAQAIHAYIQKIKKEIKNGNKP